VTAAFFFFTTFFTPLPLDRVTDTWGFVRAFSPYPFPAQGRIRAGLGWNVRGTVAWARRSLLVFFPPPIF